MIRVPAFEISHWEMDGRLGCRLNVCNDGTERIVPPAGEAYAFDLPLWRRSVEAHISPTGKSVRIWVDGVEVPPKEKP